jgi:outer membrane protein TolC
MTLFFTITFSYAAPLTWQDAFSEAFAKNPAILRAVQNKKVAEDSYRRSYSAVLPQLSASASGGNSLQGDSYSLSLSGRLSLFSGFYNTSQIKKAKAQLNAATQQSNRVIADEIFGLRSAFIDVLAAQEFVTLSEEIFRIRKQNADLIRLQYDAGREDKGSYLRTEADVYQSEYEKEQAKRNLRVAQSALIRTIGRDNEFEALSVTATFTAPRRRVMPEFNRTALETPEYLIAKYQMESSEYDLRSAKSGFYPSLDLSASVGKNGTTWFPGNDSHNAALTLSYPFFPGGRNFYDARIAKKNVEIAAQGLRDTTLSARYNVEKYWNDLVNAIENTGVREKYLAASTEQSVIITTKYLNGLESYQNWYTIQNDFINSKESLLNSYTNALTAEALWYKITGDTIGIFK